jgi:HK97 family phage portal protein
MLMSGGRLVLGDATPSPFTNTYPSATTLALSGLQASYGAIYKKQMWVYTVVRKRALATRRLPLKTYQRDDDGARLDARDTPLAALLANPNPRMSGPFLWEWTSSTYDIHGEAIWLKIRGRDGRTAELWPIHPTNIAVRKNDDGSLSYIYGPGVMTGSDPEFVIPERDVVHFKMFNPDGLVRGLSPLEPLRMTLLNEDAARRASSAFWANGGRPSGFLAHPGTLSKPAMDRLSQQWAEMHGGVDNFGKFAILEEGMEPKVLSLTAEDAQYIETRKLNQIEVCAVYDMAPPVVHILDRATFSNIVEQFRSMYRDTMAPHLSGFEATLATQLVPEFGRDLYVEFLMDEVLRGDFETRIPTIAQAIQTGQMTVNEGRVIENRPPVEGGDVLLINAALVPLDQVGTRTPPLTMQARSMDAMWGRLGSCSSLDDVDEAAITVGLNGHAETVLDALATARAEGDTIQEFRARLRVALAD